MKKLITAFLLLSSLSVFSQDSTAKVSIDLPLKFKTDTIKYKKMMYTENKFVKVDSGYVIMSGYGNDILQGFWDSSRKDNPKVRVFIANKEIKLEDFINIIAQ